MLLIQDKAQLNRADINIKQALRIEASRKRFAVINGDKLHLVNNLDRLIFDTLKSDDLYNVEVYQLRE
jgi:hypothetical protein